MPLQNVWHERGSLFPGFVAHRIISGFSLTAQLQFDPAAPVNDLGRNGREREAKNDGGTGRGETYVRASRSIKWFIKLEQCLLTGLWQLDATLSRRGFLSRIHQHNSGSCWINTVLKVFGNEPFCFSYTPSLLFLMHCMLVYFSMTRSTRDRGATQRCCSPFRRDRRFLLPGTWRAPTSALMAQKRSKGIFISSFFSLCDVAVPSFLLLKWQSMPFSRETESIGLASWRSILRKEK